MMSFRSFFFGLLSAHFSLSLGLCQKVNGKSEFKSSTTTRTRFLNDYMIVIDILTSGFNFRWPLV